MIVFHMLKSVHPHAQPSPQRRKQSGQANKRTKSAVRAPQFNRSCAPAVADSCVSDESDRVSS